MDKDITVTILTHTLVLVANSFIVENLGRIKFWKLNDRIHFGNSISDLIYDSSTEKRTETDNRNVHAMSIQVSKI